MTTSNQRDVDLSDLTVLIPVWNEEACVEGVVREFRSPAGAGAAPLLLLDDGSTDGTRAALDRLAAEGLSLRVLALPHGGKDRALWAGFLAVETGWCGIMDGDGQYVPGDFSRLLEEARARGLDAVWGLRAARSDTSFRKGISRGGRAIKRSMLGGAAVADAGCGIWVARTRYLRSVPAHCTDPAGQVHCHLAEMIAAQGGRVGEAPIRHRSRERGVAKYGLLNRLGPGWRSLVQARRVISALRTGS